MNNNSNYLNTINSNNLNSNIINNKYVNNILLLKSKSYLSNSNKNFYVVNSRLLINRTIANSSNSSFHNNKTLRFFNINKSSNYTKSKLVNTNIQSIGKIEFSNNSNNITENINLEKLGYLKHNLNFKKIANNSFYNISFNLGNSLMEIYNDNKHNDIKFYKLLSNNAHLSNRNKMLSYKYLHCRELNNSNIDFVFSGNEYMYVTQGTNNVCSLVSALISILDYEYKFKNNVCINSLLLNMLLPLDHNYTFGTQAGSVYGVRLYFNNIWNIIFVNDSINCKKENYTTLILPNKNNERVNKYINFWLFLLEKAYISIYDVKTNNLSYTIKSNSAIEMYHLISWIPEVIELNCIKETFDIAWQSIMLNYKKGRIILCLGTKAFSEENINNYYTNKKIHKLNNNIASNHSYAILDIYNNKLNNINNPIIKVKNPWGGCIDSEKYSNCNDNLGVFNITKQELFNYFSHLYIAWNPESYPYTYTIKGKFDTRLFTLNKYKMFDENYNLEYNPQYLIRIPKHKEAFELRIIIAKLIDNSSNIVNLNYTVKNKIKISYKLFSYEGKRINYPIDFLKAGTIQREINSDILTFDANENSIEEFVLVLLKSDYSNYENTELIINKYSIDFYSFNEIEIFELDYYDNLNIYSIEDIWGSKAYNINSINFIKNPTYRLDILKNNVYLQIKLETEINANIMVILLVNEFDNPYLIDKYCIYNNSVNSGFYYNGFSEIQCIINSGSYIILLATDKDQIILNYKLNIFVNKNNLESTNINHRDVLSTIEHQGNKVLIKSNLDKANNLDNSFILYKYTASNLKQREIFRGEWNKCNYFYNNNFVINKINEEYNM